MDNRWFGFKFNVRWPHDGFCFGFCIDHYEETDELPWASLVFRILFLTVIYDVGFGEQNKEVYNNQ